jgi:hypothetical protein
MKIPLNVEPFYFPIVAFESQKDIRDVPLGIAFLDNENTVFAFGKQGVDTS